MMRALLWKEYREQRLFWLVFLIPTLGVLAFAPWFAGEARNSVCLLVVLIAACTQALVSGAMLTAGEREEKTQAFLDLLPVRRSELWRGKLVAGLLLSLSLCGLLVGALVALTDLPLWQPGIVLLGACFGLAWGLWGGSHTRSVMGGTLLGVFAGLIVSPLLGFVVVQPWRLIVVESSLDRVAMLATFSFSFFLLPVSWAYWRYTAPDRLRKTDLGPSAARITWPWWSCLRLAVQIQGRLYLVLLALAVVVVTLASFAPVVVWPVGAAGLAVIVGVLLFAEEQSGPHRFLADQRLPLGIFWLTRVGLGAGVLSFPVLCHGVFLLYVSLTYRPTIEQTPPFAPIGMPLLGITIPLTSWLLMWPATGFAVGTLMGLLFRKAIVAVVVAGGLTALLLGIWLPSLIVGGLQWWQPLQVPMLLLGTSRLLMPSWAAGRRVAIPMLAWGVLALLLTAAALMYRVVSVPAVPVPDRLEAFLAELPRPTEGSERIRRASEEMVKRQRELYQDTDEEGNPQLPKLHRILQEGWPEEREIDRWFTETALAGDWPRLLTEARNQPVGLLLDPRRPSSNEYPPFVQAAPTATKLLLCDGLRIQRRENDSARMLERIQTVLVMARTFDAGQTLYGSMSANAMEWYLHEAVATWLARLEGRPDLLERLAHLLEQHPLPPDDTDYRLSAYVSGNEVLKAPQRAAHYPHIVAINNDERAYLSVALLLPWERERLDRQLRQQVFRVPLDRNIEPLEWSLGPLVDLVGFGIFRRGRERRLLHAITQLRVELRLYESKQGRFPTSLAELGRPVPRDPFGTGEIRYRLDGGRAVLWSVGEDGQDNDGRQTARRERLSAPLGEDLVFPVPPRFRPRE